MSRIYIGFDNTNGKGFKFKVIEKGDGRKWKVRFDGTGYETYASEKEVFNGNIRDWKAPYVCGIGVVGTDIDKPQSHYLYDRWRDMLRRCYDPKNKMYKTYGKVGCYVSEEWHYFVNFVRDMENKANIDKIKNKDDGVWQLDKDLICNKKGINPHYYSNETTCIITREANTKERNERMKNPSFNNNIQVMQFDTKGNYIKTWNSITQAVEGVGGKGSGSWLISCCKNKAYTYKGYCWIYKSDFTTFDEVKSNILNKKELYSKKDIKYRKIVQVLNNNLEVILEGFAEDIAVQLKTSVSNVGNSINRHCKCKGYITRYKDLEAGI